MQQEFRTREVKLPVREPSRLTSWLVNVGDTIRKGNVLCKYQLTAGGTEMSLKAPCVGVVKQLLVEVSVTLQPGYVTSLFYLYLSVNEYTDLFTVSYSLQECNTSDRGTLFSQYCRT